MAHDEGRAFLWVGSFLASRSLIFLIPLGALFRSVKRYHHGTVLELVGMAVVAGDDATVVAVSGVGAPGTKNGCAPRVKR